MKFWILGILTPAIILFDQITKQMVIDRFQLGESIVIIPSYFNFTYIRNTGAAFGILATADPAFRVPFFIIVPMIALAAIFAIFRSLSKNDVRNSLALALVVGGAIGNLIDRVAYGYVIDFLDFHWRYRAHFPAFNIADSAICVGVGMLMVDIIFRKEELSEADINASTSR